ncbi:MAG: thioredoxin family protein [Candidatus Obscuribacterales bacterium]|nr:thioredoxin family protein [Candidatus Obscuribacterales bacterium]
MSRNSGFLKFASLLILLLVFNCQASESQEPSSAQIGKSAPDFSLKDTAGKQHSLADTRGKFLVLEWINFDCPFVRKHYDSGNMQKLQKLYTNKGVIWYSVCSSAAGRPGNYSPAKLNELLKQKQAAPTAYLIDENGKTGRAYGAKATPHMFVINPKGVLIYAGAIDNNPSADIVDVKSAVNYVNQALDEALANKPVSTASTKAYGCSVKYQQ